MLRDTLQSTIIQLQEELALLRKDKERIDLIDAYLIANKEMVVKLSYSNTDLRHDIDQSLSTFRDKKGNNE